MKRKLFKIIYNIIFFTVIILIIIYNKEISNYIIDNFIYHKNATIEIDKNQYALNKNYASAQITYDFVAKDYQHLLNIIYTILDSGADEFYFFCDDEYRDCLTDINTLIPADQSVNTDDVLADINNLVHPYNSYKKLTIVMNNYGKIIVQVDKQYSNDDITYINEQIEKFEKENINDTMAVFDKIKKFHDYIINNTVYDKDRAKNMNSEDYETSESHTATGLLKNHLALCGGYSDIMGIYLSRLNIPNYRISADKHVWNLVFYDNKWVNLDATWDDPVTTTGTQLLIHDYFLIPTSKLFELDSHEHNFNQEFYKEAID